MAHHTKRRVRALGFLLLLLALLTLAITGRGADASEDLSASIQAVVSTPTGEPVQPEPSAMAPPAPSATPDWSTFTTTMNAASAPIVPPAPPLSLPTASPLPTLTPVPTATPLPTATSLPAATPLPTATSLPTAASQAGPVYFQRGQAALAAINYDLASVGYTISFHEGRSGYLGLTFTKRRHIEIYVRPSMSDSQLRYAIAHEIGHAVDHMRNGPQDRLDWRTARGMASTTPWWPVGVGSDLATPAGDFAECFATWAAGSASHSAWGGCGGVQDVMARLATS